MYLITADKGAIAGINIFNGYTISRYVNDGMTIADCRILQANLRRLTTANNKISERNLIWLRLSPVSCNHQSNRIHQSPRSKISHACGAMCVGDNY